MIWLIYISSATKVQLFVEIQKNIKKTTAGDFLSEILAIPFIYITPAAEKINRNTSIFFMADFFFLIEIFFFLPPGFFLL